MRHSIITEVFWQAADRSVGTPIAIEGSRHRKIFPIWLSQGGWAVRTNVFVLSVLLLVHIALLGWSAVRHSPNMNEPSHLAAGISHWKYGRFELFRVNPPLIRMVAALPVLIVGLETDWSKFDDKLGTRSEFAVGPDFIAANGERSLWLMTLARWACIPFSLLGAIVCYLWSRDLYGSKAGLLAATLWCLNPLILGHASCFTPDAHAAAMGIAANYIFWRYLRHPSPGNAIGAGILLGLTLLTKTTWIVLLILWPVTWLFWSVVFYEQRRTTIWLTAGQVVLIFVIGLHVLNSGYLYDGSFRKLGDYQFISNALRGNDPSPGNRFRQTMLAKIPVPLPEQYVLGADEQKRFIEQRHPSYLRGVLSNHGYWYYYAYALLVKMPLGFWFMALIATAWRFTGGHSHPNWKDELVYLLPAATIFLWVSSETEYTAHLRYVLLSIPALFLWTSQIANLDRPLWKWTIAFAMSWAIGSTLYYGPHWLAYFNELVGGPRHGYGHLANSNLDWGQDLIYLREWMEEHPEAQPMGLVYYGMFHPHSIGIQFADVPGWLPESPENKDAPSDPLNEGPRPGWYAVSVNFLTGHPSWSYRTDGVRGWYRWPYFRWLVQLQPIARAGYSIHIYHVTESDVQRLMEQHRP